MEEVEEEAEEELVVVVVVYLRTLYPPARYSGEAEEELVGPCV